MKRLFAIAALFAFLISNSAKSGAAGFQSVVDYPVGTAPRAVASADFNGDGKVDLAVANNGNGSSDMGGVSILQGNGDGTFQSASNFTVGNFPVAIAAADFNGDSRPDLVLIDSSGVGVLLGKGDGTFAAATYLSTASGPVSLAVGDLDKDNVPDLVVNASSLSVLLGNGNGTFQPHVDYPALLGRIVVDDVNGDAKLDVIGTFNGVNVSLGNGDGSLQSVISSVGPTFSVASAAADFNLDGKLDFAVAFDNPLSNHRGVVLMRGNSDGTFQLSMTDSSQSAGALSAGDFNGDAKADLVIVADGNANLLLGNGDTMFQTPLSFAVGAGPNSILAVDLNQDKAPDLVVTNSPDNTVSVLLNTTGAEFSISASAFTPATISPGQSSTSTVTLTHQNTFEDPVELTCSVQPPQSALACSVDPDSVTFDPSGNATAMVTITTGTSAVSLSTSSLRSSEGQFLWLPVAGFALVGAGFVCTRSKKRLSELVLGALVLGGLILQAACGGDGRSRSQTYTVTITGASESTQHSTTATLTVE
jgi:hypothetical protein